MKIHVIDSIGQIQPSLFAVTDDVTFFTDEIQALNATEVQLPGLIMLNFALRGSETADYIDLLLSVSPLSSIVVVGDDLPDDEVLSCLLSGANGYQHSDRLPIYISKIVRAIEVGEAWISRRMTGLLLTAIRQKKQMVQTNLSNSGLHGESPSSYTA